MKKSVKLFSFLLIIMVLISGVTAVAKTVSVYDEAYMLTDEQIRTLEEKYDAVRDKYNIDVAIAIQPSLYSATAIESADDFYDYNEYGMGENDDGILLYICSGTREYHITTHSKAIEAFTDDGIGYLKEQIVPHLQADDYYGAADAFVNSADKLLEMYANGEPYVVQKSMDAGDIAINCAIAIALAIFIAYRFTKYKLKQMKTAVKQVAASDYMKPGSMKLAYSQDIFIYSRTDTREKPQSNKSGGSSTHRSSSGRTHGGGGGSF